MHFMIHWRNKTEDLAKNADLTIRVLSAFSGHKFAKVFDTTFVVSVDSIEQYNALYDKISAQMKADTKVAQFIVTPVMSSGSYRGWLPKTIWPELNSVTRGDGNAEIS